MPCSAICALLFAVTAELCIEVADLLAIHPVYAAGFGHSPGAGPRDVPSFGPAGGHAFMEPRGDPVPAGRGRGFAIGRGRSISGSTSQGLGLLPGFVLSQML